MTWEAQCRGKQPLSAKRAWEIVERDRKRNKTRDQGFRKPYRCPFCGRWHIGHDQDRKGR